MRKLPWNAQHVEYLFFGPGHDERALGVLQSRLRIPDDPLEESSLVETHPLVSSEESHAPVEDVVACIITHNGQLSLDPSLARHRHTTSSLRTREVYETRAPLFERHR